MAQENIHHAQGSHMAGMAGAVLASAALGAAMAVLLTPKTGREVREKIVDKAHRAKSKAEEMAEKTEPLNLS